MGDVTSKAGLIFMGTVLLFAVNMIMGIPVYMNARTVYYREVASTMYKPSAYSLAYYTAEIPYIAGMTSIFVLPFYFMLNLNPDVEDFFWFYSVALAMSAVGCYGGQAIAAALPNPEVGVVAAGFMMCAVMLFAGFFINHASLPAPWVWAYYFFPGHYAVSSALHTQFDAHKNNTLWDKMVPIPALCPVFKTVCRVPFDTLSALLDSFGVGLTHTEYDAVCNPAVQNVSSFFCAEGGKLPKNMSLPPGIAVLENGLNATCGPICGMIETTCSMALNASRAAGPWPIPGANMTVAQAYNDVCGNGNRLMCIDGGYCTAYGTIFGAPIPSDTPAELKSDVGGLCQGMDDHPFVDLCIVLGYVIACRGLVNVALAYVNWQKR